MCQHIGDKKAGLFITVLIVLIFCQIAQGGETMQPLYDLKTAAKLEPVKYKIKGYTDDLFPVPRDNTVGTNSFNNAITLIRFEKDRAVYDEIARDFFKYVSGGDLSFLPVFDRVVIGYGQSRRFVRVNLKNAEVRAHRICYPIEETIQRVAVSNANKEHFIFQIEQFAKDTTDTSDYVTLLRLMDLSGKEPVLIKEKELPQTVGWFTAYDKIFFYDKKMAAYTKDLEPSHHPLVDAFNNNSDKLDAWRIYPHPSLPFVVHVDQELPTMILQWDKKDKSIMALTNENTLYFDFSPDGKWVVFQEEGTDDMIFYLMPVSEKYPHYLGSPILLFEGNFLTTCWTTNPISFVGSTGNVLSRWELTNKAYPQAGDKDLHDYIVEKDLEKLKAEKEKK